MARKKTVLDSAIACRIAHAIGTSKFDCHSYDSKYNAQRNLSGKTHWADSDTLKFFNSRILSARVMHEGLTLAIIESSDTGFNSKSRGFRFHIFDLFGTHVSDSDGYYSKRERAESAMHEYLETYNPIAHYKAAMAERVQRLKNDAAHMEKGMKTLVV